MLIVFTQKRPYEYIVGEDKNNLSKNLLFYGIAVIIEHLIIFIKVFLSEIVKSDSDKFYQENSQKQ